MLMREPRDELLPYCERAGTGVIAYGPLAYGLLTGTIDENTEFSDDDWRSGKHDMGAYDELFAPDVIGKQVGIVSRLRPIADEVGVTLPKLALAWVFHQTGVTGAIAGSRSPKHVAENAAAGDVTLDEETLAKIEQAF
jgi:aryl-alcohol dehydrogenase-like predicted oxidoreductase